MLVPSFTIEKNNPPATLKHCFIEHMLLFCPEPPATIKAKNGSVYIAVYDNLVLPTQEQSATIKVIVSFQKHSYGKFAIVRNFKPSSKIGEL